MAGLPGGAARQPEPPRAGRARVQAPGLRAGLLPLSNIQTVPAGCHNHSTQLQSAHVGHTSRPDFYWLPSYPPAWTLKMDPEYMRDFVNSILHAGLNCRCCLSLGTCRSM